MSTRPDLASNTQETTPDGRLYRRLWRWHFYAAFLVIPFVLLQSITGTLYLWHDEWADWAHPELRFVEPQAQRASLDAQAAAAQAAHPHAQATALIVPHDAHRATQVMFGGHHGESDALPFPVFVNPYSGEVLGELPGWSWMPGWSRKIHGGWPLGDAGSWLLELGACWAVVMVLTGLYLWWPRDRGLLAALIPRTREGTRVLVRDLHASVAVLFSALLLVFLVSALPWTEFWGNNVLKPLQNAIGQPSPFGAAMRARSNPESAATTLTLDEALRRARDAGVSGDIEIKLDGKPGSALSLRNRLPRAALETQLALDRGSGAVLVKTTWDDYPPIPRAVSVGVDLHEGTFFGRANQWFNTVFALALVWISATGFLSWWLRRPRGKLGAPLRAEIRLPRWALATGAALCVVMPLLGASVLGLWLVDRLTGLGRRVVT
ncbi:MAG: PepSY-associated TM helix domain-containing protein [Panacagrimonas sp.]